MIAAGKLGAVEHVACLMHSPLLWLFDDPKNVGWVAPSGAMLGNGFACEASARACCYTPFHFIP